MRHRNTVKKAKGIVKWFDDAKGYGFISYSGEDYFVHYKSIRMRGHRTLVKDQKVLFTPLPADDGKLVATEVELDENN